MEACKFRSPYTFLHHLLLLTRRNKISGSGFDSDPDSCFSLRDYFARATNFFLWLSLIIVTLLLFVKLVRLLRLWAQRSRIPGPPSPSLLSTHVTRLASPRDLTGFLSELHEEYGPIVRLWLGPMQLLVSVKDVGVIKEVMVKAKDKLPLTGRAFHLAFWRSDIFGSSFEKVQEGRESLALYMNERLLERVNKIPPKVGDCLLGRMESIMSKGILDCRLISLQVSFFILGATLFEEAFLNWSDATLYEELLMMIAKDACFCASYKFPPFWKKEYWRYQFLCTKLKQLTRDIIQLCGHNSNILSQIDQRTYTEMKSTRKKAGNEETHINSSLLEEGKGYLISNEEPCGDILGIMFHGCLTITNLVSSILTKLVLYPELQDEIFSEIIQVQQKACKQDSYDVQKMYFLLATVYEAARLLPPSPLLQRCSLKHDLNLKSNVTVPAGAILVVPLQLVQLDNSIWGDDACQFNPHRFVSNPINQEGIYDEHKISEPDKGGAYLPFGSGTRACIGHKFAILGISTLFAFLIHNYEIKVTPESENKWKLMEKSNSSQRPPGPKIVFVRRIS